MLYVLSGSCFCSEQWIFDFSVCYWLNGSFVNEIACIVCWLVLSVRIYETKNKKKTKRIQLFLAINIDTQQNGKIYFLQVTCATALFMNLRTFYLILPNVWSNTTTVTNILAHFSTEILFSRVLFFSFFFSFFFIIIISFLFLASTLG